MKFWVSRKSHFFRAKKSSPTFSFPMKTVANTSERAAKFFDRKLATSSCRLSHYFLQRNVSSRSENFFTFCELSVMGHPQICSFWRCSWCPGELKKTHLNVFEGSNQPHVSQTSFAESFKKVAFFVLTLPMAPIPLLDTICTICTHLSGWVFKWLHKRRKTRLEAQNWSVDHKSNVGNDSERNLKFRLF